MSESRFQPAWQRFARPNVLTRKPRGGYERFGPRCREGYHVFCHGDRTLKDGRIVPCACACHRREVL